MDREQPDLTAALERSAITIHHAPIPPDHTDETARIEAERAKQPETPAPRPGWAPRTARALLRPFGVVLRKILGPIIRPLARRWRAFLLTAVEENLRHEAIVNAERTQFHLTNGLDALRSDIVVLHGETNAHVQRTFERTRAHLDHIDARVTPTSIPTSDGDVIVATPAGCLVVDGSDLETLGTMLNDSEPEPGTCHVIERVLRPGDTFVDVGAGIGGTTVAAGRALGPQGHIIAIEPAPAQLRRLEKTLTLNGLQARTTVHPRTIAMTPSELGLAPDDVVSGPTGTATARIDELVSPSAPVALMHVRGISAARILVDAAKQILETNDGIAVLVRIDLADLAGHGTEPDAWLARFSDIDFDVRVVHPTTGTLQQRSLEQLRTAGPLTLWFARPGSPAWEVLGS